MAESVCARFHPIRTHGGYTIARRIVADVIVGINFRGLTCEILAEVCNVRAYQRQCHPNKRPVSMSVSIQNDASSSG